MDLEGFQHPVPTPLLGLVRSPSPNQLWLTFISGYSPRLRTEIWLLATPTSVLSQTTRSGPIRSPIPILTNLELVKSPWVLVFLTLLPWGIHLKLSAQPPPGMSSTDPKTSVLLTDS